MAPPTPRLVVPIDLKKKPWEQKLPLHNRWHPDLPPVAEVKTGEVIRVEMVDWTGGIIKDDDSANDVKFIDLSTVSMQKKTVYFIETTQATNLQVVGHAFESDFVPSVPLDTPLMDTNWAYFFGPGRNV